MTVLAKLIWYQEQDVQALHRRRLDGGSCLLLLEDMMNLRCTIEIWNKGTWYVARCPELDFVSQGPSPEEAKRNLLEVVQIQFEEMSRLGTLEDYLSECSYTRVNGTLAPQSEMVGFEKSAIQVI